MFKLLCSIIFLGRFNLFYKDLGLVVLFCLFLHAASPYPHLKKKSSVIKKLREFLILKICVDLCACIFKIISDTQSLVVVKLVIAKRFTRTDNVLFFVCCMDHHAD